MKRTHAVTVLGRALSVRSSATPEKVQAVEHFVNSRLLEIGSALRSGDAQLVLMLALLNITEELLEIRSACQQGDNSDNRIKGIIGKLESI